MIVSKKLQQAVNPAVPPILSIKDDSAVNIAASLILGGNVVAIPTDTIYGIAVSVQNNNGINKLYKIKKRDTNKPIAICVSDVNEIHLWGETSHLDNNLFQKLLPGPVTVVLKRKALLNPLLNPRTNLIGIRIPKLQFIQNLTKQCGVPLALTSANLSSETSALQINEFSHLWPELGGIFDGGKLGGPLNSRLGSTVVDLSEPGYYQIIRPGSSVDNTLTTLRNFNLKPID